MKRAGPVIVVALFIAVLVWAFAFGPWSRGEQLSLDEKVEQQWMAGRTTQDAVMFFEQGGMYEELLPKGNIDQEFVLPLARRLRDEFQLKPVVALDEPGRAMGLFVEVPDDPAVRRRIGAALQEADDAFPWLLGDFWGQRWLSLDWFDETECKVFQNQGVLEAMTSEHVRIRQAP